MAREDDRDAPVARLPAEHVRQDIHPDRVQARERLIEDQYVGLVDERGCQLDALLVPQRQGLHAVVRITDDLEELEELVARLRATPLGVPRSRARYTSCSRTRIFGYSPRSSGM